MEQLNPSSVFMCACECVYACVCVRVSVSICVCTHASGGVCVCVWLCECVCVCVPASVCARVCGGRVRGGWGVDTAFTHPSDSVTDRWTNDECCNQITRHLQLNCWYMVV